MGCLTVQELNVCKTIRPMLSNRCLSCPVLSVTFVHCGQTVGRIKMKLSMHVGLGLGHIVLGGDPAPLPQKGTAPNFRPISVAAKWLYKSRCHLFGARPRPRRLCVRWGPRSALPKRGRSLHPKFSAHVYCGQTAGWMKMVLGTEVGLIPGDFVLDGDPAPSPKRGRSPNFRPMYIAAKRLDGSRRHLV